MGQGGLMEKWKREVNTDKAEIPELFKRAPKDEFTYETLKVKELESELIAVHKLQSEIRVLLDKYSEVIHSDNEQRKQLQEDQRARRIPYP
jgi:hypothetical protein